MAKILEVKYENQAHARVCEVAYESQADLRIFKVAHAEQAGWRTLGMRSRASWPDKAEHA